MDYSQQKENHEQEEDEFLDLLSIANASIAYQAMHLSKQPSMTSSYAGYAWMRELMAEDTNPIKCYNMFRMHRDVFNNLTRDLVTRYGLKGSRNTNVEEMVGMFLYMLGHGIGNRVAQERFQRYGETISRHFSLVLNKVCNMGKDLIQPIDRQFQEVPEKIKKDRQFYPYFKDCIGAMDGTHIQAVLPTYDQIRFIGRKGKTTQNVLAVCNFNMEFIYVCVGWEGQAHDTRIFYDAIGRRDAQFPHPPPGKYYLVDAGYPNLTGYLGPYREVRYRLPEFRQGPTPTGHREVFNHAHSSLRSEIERAFGVLKMKWKILTTMPNYPYKKQVQIVIATMALHNFIRKNAVTDTDFETADLDPEYGYSVDHDVVNEGTSASNNNAFLDMAHLRDEIAMNLINS
ncbi:hypothetical protein ACJRO7_031261 [Eucalyptus globulus]|uniref:DDE Tnp4 domain-containing protein n=1 Tax=Eucalyptus globulus TaxID=34317 RepID=A0ABD3JI60_EUCGL